MCVHSCMSFYGYTAYHASMSIQGNASMKTYWLSKLEIPTLQEVPDKLCVESSDDRVPMLLACTVRPSPAAQGRRRASTY